MAKIIMGPEQVVLDRNEYLITFGVLTSIETYNEECKRAETEYRMEIQRAEEKRGKSLQAALDKLKGSLT